MKRVLVSEDIGESGIQVLQDAGYEVATGFDWTRAQLEERIGDYSGLLVRSATRVDAGLIELATKMEAIGRAGVGVDNVDVPAATKRGIVVANAPKSNVVTAAEHTMALLLALARNVPQAHGSLTAGRWERSKFSGVELADKTLGIIGFGRIGQLVAQRARAFGMDIVAYDPFIGAERFRDLHVEKAASADAIYARADFISIHLPNTPDTKDWLDAAAFAKMRDGVRILNVARGGLIVDADLQAALDSGKVAGAALDVFRSEPITEHPLFAYPNVIVTPHLGASTTEATDRAGYQAAEQVAVVLAGGSATTAVNASSISADDLEVLGPFLPLCRSLGRLATTLAASSSIDRIEVECLGRIAEHDTRALAVAVLMGALGGRTAGGLNEINAPAIAEERGIEVIEIKNTHVRDFADIVRVTVVAGDQRERVVGTTIGRRARPHLLAAWGQHFNLQLEGHLALFRYRDVPGMIGRVGTCFGAHGINIVSAAVGHAANGDSDHAVMIMTTESPVAREVMDEIVDAADFVAGRAVAL